MTSIAYEESLARETHTDAQNAQTDRQTDRLGSSTLKCATPLTTLQTTITIVSALSRDNS